MASDTDHGVPAAGPSGGPRECEVSAEAAAGATERFGPLAVSRHVKDDGRALILYALHEPPEEAGDPDGDGEPGGHGERAT